MAKRDIPEINAGSMADIAFLLLIFFLVTTTMEKDTAYIRQIPKKVETTEPIDIEKRNICAILANSSNQLMVRGELMENPDEISERVIEWYTENEKVNDPKNKFPMYSTLTMPQIEENIVLAEKALEEVENTEGAAQEIIDFKAAQLDKWIKKKEAMELYGKQELREIHFQAHVRIEVQSETAYELFAKIHSELEEAIYEMRNDAAMDLFNESYGVITKRYDMNQGDKDKQLQAREDKAKLELLDILYPDRFIEVTPKR